MSDSTFPLPERSPARVPWWKRRWRRLPFWAWAGIVLTGVGVVGAQVGGDGSGGGAAVADLTPMSTPAPTASDTSASGVSSTTTVVATTAIPSNSTTSPPQTTAVPTTTPIAIPIATPDTIPTVTPTTVGTVSITSPWTVTAVIDGDTIEIAGSAGTFILRLIGINTPESDECWADEATAALSALVAGQALSLVLDTSNYDQFGRLLRYAETAGGVDVGAALVESGHAISRRYEPDTERSDRYDVLQEQASAAGLGLWAPDACGAPVASVSISVEVRADAAGDDNDNLNDEWVRFTNAGTAPVDLGGWVVADESASHRYGFANLVLGPGLSVTLYTGCGGDTPDTRYWCNTRSAVWNNSGDTVFLRDPSGNNVVVHRY